MLLLDIDDFKAINDRFGHVEADVLLHDIGTRLRDALPARCVVARLGGDEFAALVDPADDPAGIAVRSAGALIDALRSAVPDRGRRGVRHDERRHRARQRRRPAVPPCRRRDVPGEVGREGAVRALRAVDGRRRAREARAARRAAPGAPRRGLSPPLPAGPRSHDRARRRRRGAPSLAPPDARDRAAGRLHPDRGGERPRSSELGRWVLEQACRQVASLAGRHAGRAGAHGQRQRLRAAAPASRLRPRRPRRARRRRARPSTARAGDHRGRRRSATTWSSARCSRRCS